MTDVDSTYDPKSGKTLDEHRADEFAKIEQVPFGHPTPKPEPQDQPE